MKEGRKKGRKEKKDKDGLYKRRREGGKEGETFEVELH